MTFQNLSWRAQLLPPILLLSMWWLPAGHAKAAVNCTATMTALAFGDIDLVDGTPAEANATLTYECTNDSFRETNARVCFNIGDGEAGPGFLPRRMRNGTNVLSFQLYPSTSTVIWGSNGNASVPSPFAIDTTIRGRTLLGGDGRTSGSTTLRGVLVTGQSAAASGLYQNNFSGGHTSITLNTSTGTMPTTCGTLLPGKFPFIVSATVARTCAVSANPLNFGPVDGLPGRPDTDAETTLAITCSPATAYTVSLTPLNNNTAGAGVMTPVAGGADTVPYGLYRNAARSLPWGNAANVNRVGGTGSGNVQSLTVYGRVPGANVNVRPGDYLDVVRVDVSY